MTQFSTWQNFLSTVPMRSSCPETELWAFLEGLWEGLYLILPDKHKVWRPLSFSFHNYSSEDTYQDGHFTLICVKKNLITHRCSHKQFTQVHTDIYGQVTSKSCSILQMVVPEFFIPQSSTDFLPCGNLFAWSCETHGCNNSPASSCSPWFVKAGPWNND